ncbi:MAG: hypothetical protein KIH08_05275 [Candidatus Freyarchaeota archaeon]|nr:hypothetical protein [Candidatus Jordarchaeia archaeon]MBS7268997.1 hypothetical protein [Candidatus Jordarchaeia archaeon]MBS7279648.1 hypothetical protein [Candidatus Jordarchaeia archaeon]
MSKVEVRRCESCGTTFLSVRENCPNCGKLYTHQSKTKLKTQSSNFSQNSTTLIIPLARTVKESKEIEFIPSKLINQPILEKTAEFSDFLGSGFSINAVASEKMIHYEIENVGNEFQGFAECENTKSGLVMIFKDTKGIITATIEGNPQYTHYVLKDRYNKTIGTMQQQGILKPSYTIEDLKDNIKLSIKGDPTKKEYSIVKNEQSYATVLKTSPETYKIEIKNKIDKRIPILFSIIIDAIQRRKK